VSTGHLSRRSTRVSPLCGDREKGRPEPFARVGALGSDRQPLSIEGRTGQLADLPTPSGRQYRRPIKRVRARSLSRWRHHIASPRRAIPVMTASLTRGLGSSDEQGELRNELKVVRSAGSRNERPVSSSPRSATSAISRRMARHRGAQLRAASAEHSLVRVGEQFLSCGMEPCMDISPAARARRISPDDVGSSESNSFTKRPSTWCRDLPQHAGVAQSSPRRSIASRTAGTQRGHSLPSRDRCPRSFRSSYRPLPPLHLRQSAEFSAAFRLLRIR